MPSNPMGEALLWLLQGVPQLGAGPPLSAIGTIAHGGRRAVLGEEQGTGRGADPFYAAMQAVSTLARVGVGARDSRTTLFDPTRDAVFAFPVVVVDGELLEASLPEGTDEPAVRRISRARVRWMEFPGNSRRRSAGRDGLELGSRGRSPSKSSLTEH